MVLAKKWVLAKLFKGFPTESDLELQTEELSEDTKDGEVLCETLFLTVDPYMRPMTARDPSQLGKVMTGQSVGKVIASKSATWPVGTLVLVHSGWRTHTLVDTKDEKNAAVISPVTKDLGDLSPSLAIGALGMPGATAYLGTMKILEPKEGEVLFVNAAAGAVGSVVGQIGKIKGCKVIGCAGTEEKCKWLKELGFDYVFNYKTSDLSKELTEASPDGIDCYFDNVGGNFTTTVIMKHMRKNGRIAGCGAISTYNDQPITGPTPWGSFIYNQVKLQGFIVTQWYPEWAAAFKEMAQWIREGKLKTKETVTQGFENMPKAFFGLFQGDNIGKAVIKV